jgi:hypothetical protein
VPDPLSVEIRDRSHSKKLVIVRLRKDAETTGLFRGKIILSAQVDEQKPELVELPVTILDGFGK